MLDHQGMKGIRAMNCLRSVRDQFWRPSVTSGASCPFQTRNVCIRSLIPLVVLVAITFKSDLVFADHPQTNFTFSTLEKARAACDEALGGSCGFGGGFAFFSRFSRGHATPNFFWINCFPPGEIKPFEGVPEAPNPDIFCQFPEPDLTAALTVSNAEAALAVGALINVAAASIDNAGNAGIAGTVAGFFISTDDQVDGSDLPLSGNINIPALAASGSFELGAQIFTVPDRPAGFYHLLLVANLTSVPEEDESNNVASWPFEIIDPAKPDLTTTVAFTDQDMALTLFPN